MDRGRTRVDWIAAAIALVLAACGGSGSTGLISAETALLAEVRETGECADGNGTTYCFGAIIDGLEHGDPTEPTPNPCVGTDCAPVSTALFTFDPAGLTEGTYCAVATRTGDEPWAVGELSIVGTDSATFDVVAPPMFTAEVDTIEAALLCFDVMPDSGVLPSTLDNLADAGPSIIFVAPVV